MKATVVRNEDERIDVVINGREYGLDTFRRGELLMRLKCGDTIQVKRVANNPFLVPVEGEEQ